MAWGLSNSQVHVGRRLTERREASGLSQEELAACIGVSLAELRLFETGAKKIPPKRLIQIAETLKTSLGSLLEGAADVDCSHEMSSRTRELLRFLAMPEAYALISAFIAIPGAEQRLRLVEEARSLGQPADDKSGRHP